MPHRSQRGMGLVGAIALITFVAVLAAGMVSMVRAGSAGSSATLLGTRAFLAAESGAQLALNRLHAPAGAGSCADRAFTFAAAGLRGCRADTTCAAETVDGDAYFTITSNGSCDAGDLRGGRIVVVRTRP